MNRLRATSAVITTLCLAALAIGLTSAARAEIKPAIGDTRIARWKDDSKGVFLLMIDDSWPSHWQVAAPELAKRGMTAAFYICPGKATVFAQRLAYRPALDVLAPWTVAADIAEWHVEVAQAGTYEVTVNLAADDKSAGDFYIIETEGSRTRAEVPNTGDYGHFKEQPSGPLTLRAGFNRILLRPDGPLKQELADVRGLRLVPTH